MGSTAINGEAQSSRSGRGITCRIACFGRECVAASGERGCGDRPGAVCICGCGTKGGGAIGVVEDNGAEGLCAAEDAWSAVAGEVVGGGGTRVGTGAEVEPCGSIRSRCISCGSGINHQGCISAKGACGSRSGQGETGVVAGGILDCAAIQFKG